MDEELLKQIWPIFRAEAAEYLEALNGQVRQLEKDSGSWPDGLIETIRRHAHSLKGSAASLGFNQIELLAHALETAIERGAKVRRFDAAAVEQLVQGLEKIDDSLDSLEKGGDGQVEGMNAVIDALCARAPASGDGSEPVPPAPPSAPDPITAQGQSAATDEIKTRKAPRQGTTPPHVLRLELFDHVFSLKARVAEALASSSNQELPDLLQAVQKIRDAATQLKLGEIDAIAGDLSRAVAAAVRAGPGAVELERLPEAVAQLEEALTSIDVAPAAVTPSAEATFTAMALRTLSGLEELLGSVQSPFAKNRGAQGQAAVEQATMLETKATLAGALRVAALARRTREGFEQVTPQGLPAALTVRLAGALTELRGELEQAEMEGRSTIQPIPLPAPTPVPTASSPRAEPSKGEAQARVADRSIRVSEKTLDSLALQIEDIAMVVAREERRTRELRAFGVRSSEILQRWEQGGQAQRSSGGGGSGLLEEGAAQLRSLGRDISALARESSLEMEHLRLVSAVVRNDLRDLRMVTASTVLDPLRRTARDVATRLKKSVELRIIGGDVRLDRRILDELKDPLQHLVRNAVDHGLEPIEQRVAAGKSETGLLELKLEQRGHRVAVVVSDDGAGLSLERIRATAVRRGLLSSAAAEKLDPNETAMLIFRPGFSTADQVTAISGRGVGLDVVHETITRLQGVVSVDFTPGKGTRFTLDLPLTLAAAVALLVEVGTDQVAIPIEAVQRILRLAPSQMGTVAGRVSIEHEKMQVPLTPLAQVIGVSRGNMSPKGHQLVLVLSSGNQTVAFGIDGLAGQENIVVQSLGKTIARAAHLAGAAVLEGGRVVGVLNVPELIRSARPQTRGDSGGKKPRILVVDDSLTTRTAMKAVLEIAGYTVVVCRNGLEAFNTLKQTPCRLVVSDVQMPELDGLGLTQRIRSDPELASTPVILVTSLDSPEDRAAGLAVGADGYLVKREVERGKLLELVKQLMPAG